MADFNSIVIDHINLGVKDVETSSAFYSRALAPLGIKQFLIPLANQWEKNLEIDTVGESMGEKSRNLNCPNHSLLVPISQSGIAVLSPEALPLAS
jgi:catechol 2,3-dioxygenase-like lactoylglutathione lyase family enzyme